MRLFIGDKFLEAFTLLDKNTQKKTSEFIQKFRKDSKNSSINLETCKKAKDKQMRSVRIDQKYRAILHAPLKGDEYQLLWIDNHDAAYAWAENKVIEWNNNTNSFQMYESADENVNEKTNEKIKDTFIGKFSERQLLKIGIPKPLIPSIKIIDSYSDLEKLEEYLPKDTFENIYYLLEGIPIDDLINEIEEGACIGDQTKDKFYSANNRRNFFEVTNDSNIEELLDGDFDKWKIFLHPSQRIVVNSDYKGSFKLTGGAGTGKTVAALHRIKRLCMQINGSKPVLFTTFTKSLIKNLKKDIISLGIEPNKVVVENIHSLIYNETIENGLIPKDSIILEYDNTNLKEDIWTEVLSHSIRKYDKSFLESELRHVIIENNIKEKEEYLSVQRIGMKSQLGRIERSVIWGILESYNKLRMEKNAFYQCEISNFLTDYYNSKTEKPFEYIVADEIQDFTLVELRLLRALTSKKENDLFLAGDPLQNIYNTKTSLISAGINIRGNKSKRLKVNYRTTREIKNMAVKVLDNIDFDDFDGNKENKSGYVSLLRGMDPEYKLFTKLEDQNEFLLNHIKQSLDERYIDFLVPNDICLASRDKKSLNNVKKYLHNNIKYYDITNNEGDINGIRLSTFHNLKGLEFKLVILFDVSSLTVPSKPHGFNSWTLIQKQTNERMERSLLYVAMSRAIKELLILGIGQPTMLLK